MMPSKTNFIRTRKTRIALSLSLLLTLTVCAAGLIRNQAQSPEQILRDGWTLAEQAGRYRFTSQVTQTTLPAPRGANVGQIAHEDELIAQGNVDRRANNIQLLLWDNVASASDPKQALEVSITDGQARGRVKGSEWKPLDAISDAFAPGGDLAAYLVAARHVTDLGIEQRNVPTLNEPFVSHRYHFVIDGTALATYLTEQLENELRKKGELPPGLTLGVGEGFRQIAGTGEAWLDSDGLPLRLQADIEFPEQRTGERVLVHVQTDFSAFDRSQLFLTTTQVASHLRAIAYRLQQSFDGPAIGIGLATFVLAVAVLLLLRGMPARRAQGCISLALLLAIWTGQVAQAKPYELPASLRGRSAPPQNSAGQKPPPEPEANMNAPEQSALQDPALISQPGRYSPRADQAAADPVTGPDADRDGLPDSLEPTWHTDLNNPDSDGDGLIDGEEVRRCPDLTSGLTGLNSSNLLQGQNAAWPGCANPKQADTDGDGLTDNQEAIFLGTSPNASDTDGDGLSDFVEVRGYVIGNNPAVYSNALNADTDGDGLLDGIECPTQPCQDSDGDGQLDFNDVDNDNDGFIGSFDNAPFSALGKATPFTRNNPLLLSVQNLNAGKSVFVDFQVRPTNANHIGYGQSVLDWPSGDIEGQIQRRLDTTFADVNAMPAGVRRPDNDSQRNGDMRLVPVLEIEMNGSRAPLPRTTAVQTVTVQSAPLLAVIQVMTESEAIEVFGFTASEKQDLRIRVTALNPDYNNYSLEIYQGSCFAGLTTPLYTASNLAVNGETTFPGAKQSIIADGGHVALLKATGLSPQCLPIDKTLAEASYVPLTFELPINTLGTIALKQAGANVQVSSNLAALTGSHKMEIYAGNCQARQSLTTQFTVNAVGSVALSALRVVDLADGKHALLVYQGNRVLTCSELGNVVNGAGTESEMIDTAAMGKLDITVSEADAAGTLIAHVPLNMAYDAKTGTTGGFAGTMLYDRTAATQWSNHKVRMSWWVQVLTDLCTTPPADFMAGQNEQARQTSWCGANANQTRLVHAYDESWQLASLSVREEQNFDMDIVYEDPTSDPVKNGDGYLWNLAQGLDEQFVTGVDCVRATQAATCTKDSQRDYTLNTIYNTFHKDVNGSVSAGDRWGIPQATFRVEKLDTQLNTYLDQGLVMQKYVPEVLNSRFLANGKSIVDAPLFLFASESSFRHVALGQAAYASTTANSATINFHPANNDAQPVKTIASLSWAPYRYDTGGQSWEAYPFEEYWDLLAIRLKNSGAINAGSDEDNRAVTNGKVRIAQTYFAYLYGGRAGLVQSDNIAIGQWNINANDFVSRDERQLRVLNAGELSEAIGDGSLINVFLEPLIESLIDNLEAYQFQQAVIKVDKLALLQRTLEITGDNNNTTRINFLKSIGGDTKEALAEAFFKNFKANSLSHVGGRVTGRVAAGLAIGSLVAGIAAGTNAGLNGANGLTVARNVLYGVTLAKEIMGAVDMLATASKAIEEAGTTGLKAFATVRNALSETTKAERIAGVVGLAVGEIFNYSFLIAQLAINHLTPGDLEADKLAAQSIATSAYSGMMFALASTGIGAIVVAIIALIDGVIFLACGFLDDEQIDSVPGQVLCQGISGWLTQVISFGIYAQNEITRVSDPHRLSYLNYQPSLSDPATGFRASAGLSLALKVRNTLRLAHLPVNIGILYGWQYSNDTLQSARFAYDIVSAKPAAGVAELHASVTRSSGSNPWLPLETNAGGDVVSFYADQSLNSGNKLTLPQQAGLNQKTPALLAEGYAVPVQECINTATFLFPLPPIVACWVRSRGETNYNDLNLVYDVLPATLDDFYALTLTGDKPGQYRQAWANNPNLPFPGLVDADGDGLRYDADADDSRWDADGDGSADAIELSRKSNPSNPDSDNDGLSDRREQIWGTNPIVADTDGDGVSDGDEIAGWSIGYGADGSGNILRSWTFSDPTERDMDGDSISDAQEKVYGFNPNLANESTALRYDARVIETKAPLLLTRFDEGSNASTFVDSSTGVVANNATCATGKCPVAGVRGRFGNAVFFNGIDQYLTSAPNPAIGNLRSNITLSAWVKPSKLSGKQAVIQIGPGGPNGIGGLTFGLLDNGLYVQYEGGKGIFTQPLPGGIIALDQWSYIAIELYRVNDTTHQLYFYANSNVERGVVAGLQKDISVNPEIVIGAAQQPAANVPPNKDGSLATVRTDYFAGAIDEVLIQGWVPIDTSSINALWNGRYNPDDLLLRQGEDAAYASHLENALMTRTIAGQRSIQYPANLTDEPSTQAPFMLEPTRSREYTDTFTITSTAASGRYSLAQSVSGIVSVPARDVWKDPGSNKLYEWLGPQLYAGTSNTVSDGSQPVDLNNKSFTIAAWVKPMNGDSARRGILGRNSGQNDAFPYLLTQGTQLKFGFGTGASKVEVTAYDGDTNVLTLNEWNYIAVRYELATRNVTFFVNTAKLNTVATGIIPNSADQTFLIGRASNLGKLNLAQMSLTCEGDGIGDGEYDLIHDGSNIWHGIGSEVTNWPLNINQSFNDTYLLTMCEDDNGINNDCGSGDRDMGSLYFSTDLPSFSNAATTYGYPQGTTVCAYDWGRVLWPDIATITYTFSNDSQPFIGELRGIEIHAAALGDSEILNIGTHGDKVAQFRLDEFPSATSFNDAIAYHLMNCIAPTCPQTGVAGKQNLSAYFDGVDDHLVENGAQADYTGSDISGNSSGFALSLWIKPAVAVPPIGAGGLINIASWKAPISGAPRGDLNLVHATNGYVLAYKDQTVGAELFRCQPGVGQVYGYGQWHHLSLNVDRASKTVSLYVDAVLCNSTVVQAQIPYIPILNDSLELGHSNDIQTFYYTGNLDDVNIHRKALTQQEVFALYRQGEFEHWNLDGAVGDPKNRVSGVLGGALKFGELADRYILTQGPGATNQYDGDLDSNPNTPNPMTFAMWVKAENTTNRILPMLSIRSTIDQHLDMVLFLNNGIPSISYLQSNTGSNQIGVADKKISDNIWQHLVFRKDDSGGMSIFINGYKASSIASNWDLSDVRGASSGLVLGGDRVGATLDDLLNGRFFNGRIDEVIVYRAALTDQEIRELYNYQNAWVDERVSSEITVDADAPTADLPLKTLYFPNAPQLLQIVAHDATSKISNAQLGVDAGAGTTWVGASADTGDVEGNTWIPLFTPSGEGAYKLSAQATDSVGNSGTPSADQTIYVDGTAPNITFNAVANLIRPTASGSDAAVWYLDLTGASFDPNIANTNQPGSGRASIDVTLSNGNGEAATLLTTQRATLIPNTDSWTIRYKLNAANPTGEYQINAVAVDKVGNRRSANPLKIKIDTTAPQAHVTVLNSPTYQQAVALAYAAQGNQVGALGPNALNAAYPEWLDGQSTIGGVVTENPADVVAQRTTAGVAGVEVAFAPVFGYGAPLRNQPLSAATLLYLPLDESSRTASQDQQFADVSPAKQSPLICANTACPLAGAPGRSGQALAFDGLNDSIMLSNTAAINGLTSDFTVAAWIKPKTLTGFQRIVSTARSNSDNGYGLGIADGHLLFTTYGVKDYVTTNTVLDAGAWQHVAVHLNASNAAEFYINGLLIETIAGSAPANADGDDRLLIGATSEPSNTATSQHFSGLIDEVVVMRGLPTISDWETLLGTAPTLHLNFDEPLINPNVALDNNAGLAIQDAAYHSTNLPADQNLHTVGKVGPGALGVSESTGALRGEAAPGVLPDKNGAFSMAYWVKLANAASQMTFWIGQSNGTQNRVVIKPNSLTLQFTGQADLNIGTASLVGSWHHVAVAYDGSRRILYLDGLEVGRGTIATNTLNTMLGGTFAISGTGAIDDVRIYRYAINPQEAKALATMGWQATNTINAAGGLSETTWSASVPVGLEGLYELQSRGTDKLGNVSDEPSELVTWRGTIDSLAPRLLSYTATKNGTGTTYALTVEDFDLAINSVEVPLVCTINNTTTVTKRYESPWYLALAEQVSNAGQANQVRSRTYQLSILCQASTTATTGRFRVCDIAGNCTAMSLGPQNPKIYFPIVNKT